MTPRQHRESYSMLMSSLHLRFSFAKFARNIGISAFAPFILKQFPYVSTAGHNPRRLAGDGIGDGGNEDASSRFTENGSDSAETRGVEEATGTGELPVKQGLLVRKTKPCFHRDMRVEKQARFRCRTQDLICQTVSDLVGNIISD